MHCRSLRDDVRDVLGLEVVDDELVPRKGGFVEISRSRIFVNFEKHELVRVGGVLQQVEAKAPFLLA